MIPERHAPCSHLRTAEEIRSALVDTDTMNLNKQSIATVDVAGKRVLMRVDFNVPQDKSGAITNNQVCLCRAS